MTGHLVCWWCRRYVLCVHAYWCRPSGYLPFLDPHTQHPRINTVFTHAKLRREFTTSCDTSRYQCIDEVQLKIILLAPLMLSAYCADFLEDSIRQYKATGNRHHPYRTADWVSSEVCRLCRRSHRSSQVPLSNCDETRKHLTKFTNISTASLPHKVCKARLGLSKQMPHTLIQICLSGYQKIEVSTSWSAATELESDKSPTSIPNGSE